MTCGWTPTYSECSTASVEAVESLDTEARSNIEAMAIEFLWNWTGRVFGPCPTTIRPCRPECYPTTYSGGASAFVCGECPKPYTRCDCGDTSRSLTLPGPVDAIEGVRVDGHLLPATSYRVDNRRILVRTDGLGWPTCQDVSAPSDEVGTWEVTYTRGLTVPIGGRIAAGVLASELALAWCNDSTCSLPQRVQSITRQGVTVAVMDGFEDVEKGRTGIWLIDSWVASVTRPRAGAAVVSPDYRPSDRRRVQTWPSRI